MPFDGPYLGGGVGTGRLSADGVPEGLFGIDSVGPAFRGDDAVFSLDDRAAGYALHAGYDFRRGDFVFGPELRVFAGGPRLGGDAPVSYIASGRIFSDEAALAIEIDHGVTATLRGGYAIGRTLVYGAAGLAYLDIDVATAGNLLGDNAGGFRDTGYAVGLGVERMLGARVSVGAQYMVQRFGDFDFEGYLRGDREVDFEMQSLELRASLRF